MLSATCTRSTFAIGISSSITCSFLVLAETRWSSLVTSAIQWLANPGFKRIWAMMRGTVFSMLLWVISMLPKATSMSLKVNMTIVRRWGAQVCMINLSMGVEMISNTMWITASMKKIKRSKHSISLLSIRMRQTSNEAFQPHSPPPIAFLKSKFLTSCLPNLKIQFHKRGEKNLRQRTTWLQNLLSSCLQLILSQIQT